MHCILALNLQNFFMKDMCVCSGESILDLIFGKGKDPKRSSNSCLQNRFHSVAFGGLGLLSLHEILNYRHRYDFSAHRPVRTTR